MRRRSVLKGLLAGVGALAAPAPAWSANSASADFFKGKTLTLIVGYAPGGGVDSAARLIARHLARFIPGSPNIVVQNMEGAGGVVSAAYLERRAAPDGLTIGVPGRSWFIEGIVKSPGATYDPTKFSYIGSSGTVNSLIWVRSDSGIATVDDLKAAKEPVVFGALGPSTPTAMVPNLLAAAGLPIKVIPGYVSTARTLVAIEQGEVPALFLNEDGFSRRPDLVEKKVVIPILQTKPVVANLPLIGDLLPAGDRPLLNLSLAAESFGLMVIAPPAVPPDRLTILRQAFVAMAHDDEYKADALKSDQPRGEPLDGAQIETMMKELAVSTTPEIIAAYNKIKTRR